MTTYTNGYCSSCYHYEKTYTVESLPDGNDYKTCTNCNTETLVTEDDNLIEVVE